MSNFFKHHWLGVFLSSVGASLLAAYLYDNFLHRPSFRPVFSNSLQNVQGSAPAATPLLADSANTGSGSTSLSLKLAYTIRGANYESLSFSRDGKWFATASGWKSPAIVWDAHTQQIAERLASDSNWIGGVTFSSDGKLLAVGHSNGKVRLWDTLGRLIDMVDIKTPAYSVSFSPDGTLLGIGTEGKVILWNLTSRKQVNVIRGDFLDVRAITFSPDNRYIAVSDGPAKVFDVSDDDAPQQPVRAIGPNCQARGGLSFSADGEYLAGACQHGIIWVGRVTSGETLRSFRLGTGSGDGAVKFSPRGYFLAAAANNILEIMELSSGTKIFARSQSKDEAPFWYLDFSGDGKRLATVESKFKTLSEIKLWNIHY